MVDKSSASSAVARISAVDSLGGLLLERSSAKITRLYSHFGEIAADMSGRRPLLEARATRLRWRGRDAGRFGEDEGNWRSNEHDAR